MSVLFGISSQRRRRALAITIVSLMLLGLTLGGCQLGPTEVPTESPEPSATPPSGDVATSTPMPTETPSVTPSPVPPTPTTTPTPSDEKPTGPLPAGRATPPPTGFDPTPPAPFDPGSDAADAWARDYVALVTALLNSERAVDEALDTVVSWVSPPDGGLGGVAEAAWAQSVDVDGDEAEELWISVPLPGQGCGATFCPVLLVLYERDDGIWQPVHVAQAGLSEEPWVERPELRLIEDVNADGSLEVVIELGWCGAHTCFTQLLVGQWTGETWLDLTADSIDQAYTDVTIEDRDDDGVLEFVLYGGTFGSVGAGLQRQRTLIFDWVEGAYRLVADIPDPSDHAYYLMLDANQALRDGDLDRALSLATQAVEEPSFEEPMGPVEEVDQRRIISFAAVEAMLVHALRDDVDGMEAVLSRAREHAVVMDNIYTDAAERLIEVYRETGDAVQACSAMEDVVAADPDEAVFFQWYGYGTERMTLDDVCPLDAPSEGTSLEI